MGIFFRKRKTFESQNMKIVSIAKRLKSSSSTDISISMDRQGISISPTTVKYQLNEQDLTKLRSL